ncbi:MAG TPA: hypothetical protein VGJ78_02965, partial [Vicinamibacterales bacterium]
PDFNAPPPRTADGKPNLSGVWGAQPPPRPAAPAPAAPGGAAAGTPPTAGTSTATPAAAPGGQAAPSGGVFGNIGAQVSGGAPYQPWAADLVKQRMADNSKDNPDAHCLPMGVMQMISHPFPRKIIQTPAEVVIIYEASGTTVREIFLDGRPLPSADAQPWWNGYSVGRWEGDTLVVETSGFLDDRIGWLDVRGSPLTSAGKLIERYRRPSYGTLEIEVTIDDPKAYTKPFTAKVNHRLNVESQLIEFVCLDKDVPHYVGAEYNKK